jgi:dihydrofolate reductase
MGGLVVVEFVTLDGVMQGFGSPDEDRDDGFDLGGWGPPYADETQFSAAVKGLQATSAYLFGRRTYEKMISFWPYEPHDNPMAAHLNATPKYVVTRTLKATTWSNSQVLDGDLVPAILQLKAASDGDIVRAGQRRLGGATDHP